MSTSSEVQTSFAPTLSPGARGAIRWVCTSNPFYVLSAGMFLAGLWMSFEDPAQAEETWAMMSGLAGYTLLLAATAYLLVRHANVWDDVRTVLLLVVLMFLATSVTFDQVLAQTPERGWACFLLGLAFAILVSEGLLRGIRLALPAWFRMPYYLILALFFLYPLALTPLLEEPESEYLMWGLFGFASVGGLVFLTLLPAIRRGPDYVNGNGSPWIWPLYPWVLFGMLACAVPARAVLLSWSMHLVGAHDFDQLIFGPYFLVPFGLAMAALILEAGMVSNNRGVQWLALAIPMGLVGLTLVGHRSDPFYQEFLGNFQERLGGTPMYLTLLSCVAFYFYAAARRIPIASEALTAALAALAVVGPNTLRLGEWSVPQAEPLLLAAALQLGLGTWQGQSWRCAVGGLAAVAALTLPMKADPMLIREGMAFHLVLLVMLLVGATFDDRLARILRNGGAGLVFLACLGAMSGRFTLPAGLPGWTMEVYSLAMASFLIGYGLILRNRVALTFAGTVFAMWLLAAGWQSYRILRQLITGLDYLAVSMALFVLAILISLGKSGLLTGWLATWRRKAPQTPE